MITPVPRPLEAARFPGRPRVYHPGRALVADVELSADSDPYLADHRLDGALMFPVVLAMEAMAQVAAPLTTAERVPVFENAEFLRPIVIPAAGPETIRMAALNRGDRINVAIRSSGTGFRTDMIRATLRYPGTRPADSGKRPLVADGTRVPLDPATDLYGAVVPRSRRFQRVLGYRRLAARSCVAEISAPAGGRRATSFPDADPMLGDPATRQAFLDAIQGCVPHARLLPVAVERVYPARSFSIGDPEGGAGQFILRAAERHRSGDTYTYDLDVLAPSGMLLDCWRGLRLVAVQENDGNGPWAPALLGPYLERGLAGLGPDRLKCVVEPDTGDRESRRRQITAAIRRMLGRPALVWHREDGRAEVAEEGIFVSAAHGAGVMLAVIGAGRTGCDARLVRERPAEEWQALLGAERFVIAEQIGRERGEPLSVAATRIWAAAECLRETGRAMAEPMMVARSYPDGWIRLGCGQAQITTFPALLRGAPHPVVFAILTEGSGYGSVLRAPSRR